MVHVREVNSLIIPCSDLAEHDAYFSFYAENLEEREQAAHWFPCIFRCSQGSENNRLDPKEESSPPKSLEVGFVRQVPKRPGERLPDQEDKLHT